MPELEAAARCMGTKHEQKSRGLIAQGLNSVKTKLGQSVNVIGLGHYVG